MLVGASVGAMDGGFDGMSVGERVGSPVGTMLGVMVGTTLGIPVSLPAVSVVVQVTVMDMRLPLLHQPPLTSKSPQPRSVGGDSVHASSCSLTPQAPIGIASELYAAPFRFRVPPSNSSALQMATAPFSLFQNE